MFIKVCGLTEQSNINAVCALQPAYVGFIFYRLSSRHIVHHVHTPANFIGKRVGVFVNSALPFILSKISEYALNAIQLHGNETPDFCDGLRNKGTIVFKAFGINSHFSWRSLEGYQHAVDYFLFDTYTAHHGGSGSQFPWSVLSKYHLNVPFILSGGIRPTDADNIKALIHPMLAGVDINSKFEVSPGIKNTKSIQIFQKQLLLPS